MSAAAKRAQKRKAKKEEADNHAAVATIASVAATMSVAGASAAAAAVTNSFEASSAASAASSAPAAVHSSDPRVILKERGNKAFGDKNMVDAIRFFTEAIEAPITVDTDAAAAEAAGSASPPPPFLASVHSNRSAAYAATYEWEAAIEDANQAIKLAPAWCKGQYRLGQALEGQMKFEAARAAYTAGLALDSSDVMLQRQLEAVNAMIAEMAVVTPEEADSNPEADIFNIMIQWLIKGRSRFPALYLKYYSSDYRGVHSLDRIGKDEIVLEIPLSHIMTSEVAKASDVGALLIASGIELNSTHSFLACYLLQERRNPNSFWRPYLDILPRHYKNMPIFFEQHELDLLKGSFSLGKIADRHAELKEEYDNIVRHVPSFAQYKLDEFVWARSVVITRIFGLMINGQKTDGLVPMADMLNHRRPRETSWTYDDSRGAFTITSLTAMARGQQIYDSYGRKCNSRFFVNYGFSLDDNEDNQAVMWFTLPTTDSHYAIKVRMLNNAKVGVTPNQPKRFQIPIQYEEDVAKECFSFLRFVHAKDSEVIVLQSGEKFDIKKVDPINIRNELEVISDLAIAAQNSLSQFDTTIEQDNAILADPNVTFNVRNAVLMRRGEKQVLQYYIELAGAVQKLVDMSWAAFKKHAAKLENLAQKGKFDAYLSTVIVPLIRNAH